MNCRLASAVNLVGPTIRKKELGSAIWSYPSIETVNPIVLGSTVGNTIVTLQPGDELDIHMLLASPPWNAKLVLIRDHWAISTIERLYPTASDSLDFGEWNLRQTQSAVHD